MSPLRLPLSTVLLTAALALGGTGCAGASQATGAAEARAAQAPLTFDVFTADEQGLYVTSTLIMGEKDAVLVDAQFTLGNGQRLASWIASHGKHLTAIYVTHAHPDHYFGVQPVLDKFPGTPVYAVPEVVAVASATALPKVAQWTPVYGAEIPRQPVLPTVLEGDHLTLEGQRLEILRFAQGDTADVTALHVPSLGLVVGGDLLYSGVHVWLAEVPKAGQRAQWLASLDRLASLSPRAAVPGHMKPGSATDAQSIAGTRAYIEAFNRNLPSASKPEQLSAAMTQAFPGHALPVVLNISVQAVAGPAGAH